MVNWCELTTSDYVDRFVIATAGGAPLRSLFRTWL